MWEWILTRAAMVALLILANSFFVAAEFALVSLRETRIEQWIANGKPGATTVLQLKRSMDEFLPAVQLGVTLASLALGWIGEPSIALLLERGASAIFPHTPAHLHLYVTAIAIAIAFAVITYFELLLGELVPKALALQRADRIALAVAGPMDVFIRLTRPAVRLMNASATAVLRLFGTPLQGEGAVHSPEELKLIASSTRRMGLLPPFQEELIHRSIELSHIAVREIMTPRSRIFSLNADTPLEQASARIVDEQHSRVPVFEASHGPEHIVGVVHAKDVARLMHFLGSALVASPVRARSGVTLREVMHEVLFVPETKLVADLLQEFQERRRQIAIVVDEFGTTAGLVTAEDALEQIVGELEDEYDTVAVRKLLPTGETVVLDGATTLRDLSTALGWTFPREPGVETLAGFLLRELGHLPTPGESVEHAGRHFRVEEMTGHRISRIRVEPTADADLAGATEDDGLEVSA